MDNGRGALEVEVPAQSPITSLDETLSTLLRDELAAVDISGVQVTFEAPERDRVATWPSPTLNLFLYDLRESAHPPDRSWMRATAPGQPALQRAPLRVECSYAITAWTREVLDEHRLLSQVLGILLAYPELTPDGSDNALPTRVGHARPEGRSDFWTAIGSPFKASLEYMATVVVESGVRRPPAPSVSGVGIRPAEQKLADPRPSVSQGGTVTTSGGEPATGAWVLVAQAGRSAVVDAAGHFVVSGIAAGSYEVRARGQDGSEATITATVPGPPLELVLGR